MFLFVMIHAASRNHDSSRFTKWWFIPLHEMMIHPASRNHDSSRFPKSWFIPLHEIMINPASRNHYSSRFMKSWFIPLHEIMIHPASRNHDSSRSMKSWLTPLHEIMIHPVSRNHDSSRFPKSWFIPLHEISETPIAEKRCRNYKTFVLIQWNMDTTCNYASYTLSFPRNNLKRLCISQLNIIEPRHEKTCLQEFPTTPDTNPPAQPQKLARVLKFRL